MSPDRMAGISLWFDMSSTRLPATFLDDKVLLSEATAWAYFALPTVSYDFLGDGRRRALANGIAIALAGLRDAECHLAVVPRAERIGEWAAMLDRSVTRPAPGWPGYLRMLQEHLAEQDLTRKQVYLGVALGRRRQTGLRSPWARRAERIAGLHDPAVSEREIDEWHRRADSVRRILGAGDLRARHATSDEVCWLIQRCLHRGMVEPPPSAAAKRRWGAGELEALAEGVLENGHRMLRLLQPHDERWLAFIALARFPDTLPFPGGEWLYHFTMLDFPVEVSMRMRLLSAHRAAADVGRKLAEAYDQERHIAETGADVPLHLSEQLEGARALGHQLQKSREPLVYAWPRLAVSGETPQELTARVEELIEQYRDLGIDAVWPTGDQLALFMEALPGDRIRVKAYEQKQPVITVAGGMFIATSDLGDHTGPYIGQTTGPTRTAVHFDPLRAAQYDRPTAITITGEPGGGKTTVADLLAYQLALRGAWVDVIDPKGDTTALVRLSGLDKTRLLEISSGDAGLLDPFALADDAEQGAALAAETLRLLLPPDAGFTREGALLTVCQAIAEEPDASLSKVVDRLLKHADPEARDVGAMLGAVSTYPLAKLCFAPHGGHRITPDEHLTVIYIAGLSLPEPGTARKDQGWPERLSVAVMFLVTDFVKRLQVQRDPRQPKAIIIDEAWALTATPQGRQLIESLARMGRRHNTVVILVSQNADDFLSEKVRNCVSAKFAFRSTDEGEVQAVLRLLGIEDTPAHAEEVRSLRNGECIFADLDGRVGTIAIDLVSAELLQAFDTTPRPLADQGIGGRILTNLEPAR
jgi:AAA-like domain